MPKSAEIRFKNGRKGIGIFSLSDPDDSNPEFLPKIKRFIKENRSQITEIDLEDVSLNDVDLENILGSRQDRENSISGSKIGIIKKFTRFIDVVLRHKNNVSGTWNQDDFDDVNSEMKQAVERDVLEVLNEVLVEGDVYEKIWRDSLNEISTHEGKTEEERLNDQIISVQLSALSHGLEGGDRDNILLGREVLQELRGVSRSEMLSELSKESRDRLWEVINKNISEKIWTELSPKIRKKMEVILKKKPKRLHDDDLAFTNLKKLNLSKNSLTPRAMLALEYAVEMGGRLDNLEEIDLSHNNFGLDGGKIMAQIIDSQRESRSSLRDIKLSDNDIRGEAALEIAYSLKNHDVVKNLDLRNNSISSSYAKKIIEYLRNHNSFLDKMDLTDSSNSSDENSVVAKSFNRASHVYGEDAVMFLGMAAAAGAYVGTQALLASRGVDNAKSISAAAASSFAFMYGVLANSNKNVLYDFAVKNYNRKGRNFLAEGIALTVIGFLFYPAINRSEGERNIFEAPYNAVNSTNCGSDKDEDCDEASPTYSIMAAIASLALLRFSYRMYVVAQRWDKSTSKKRGEAVESVSLVDSQGEILQEVDLTEDQEEKMKKMINDFKDVVNQMENPSQSVNKGDNVILESPKKNGLFYAALSSFLVTCAITPGDNDFPQRLERVCGNTNNLEELKESLRGKGLGEFHPEESFLYQQLVCDFRKKVIDKIVGDNPAMKERMENVGREGHNIPESETYVILKAASQILYDDTPDNITENSLLEKMKISYQDDIFGNRSFSSKILPPRAFPPAVVRNMDARPLQEDQVVIEMEYY